MKNKNGSTDFKSSDAVLHSLKWVFELRRRLWYVYETRVKDPLLRVLLYHNVKDFGLNLAVMLTQDKPETAQEYWQKYSPYVLENNICKTELDIYVALLYMEAENLIHEELRNNANFEDYVKSDISSITRKREELHVLYPLEEEWVEGYLLWSDYMPEIDFSYMTRQIYLYLLKDRGISNPMFKPLKRDLNDDINPYIPGVIYISSDGVLFVHVCSNSSNNIFHEVARVSPTVVWSLSTPMGGTKDLNESINKAIEYNLNHISSTLFTYESRTGELPLIGIYKGTTISEDYMIHLLEYFNS